MMVAIMEGKWQNVQMTADYKVGKCKTTFTFSPPPPGEETLMANFKGRDYTASLTAGNPDLLGGSGMAVCHYLQVMRSYWSSIISRNLLKLNLVS